MVDDAAPWSSARRVEWLRSVNAWLDDLLAPSDERCEALEPVKVRPWGAVLRAHTTARRLYVKAVGPRGRHEVRLLSDIARRSPGLAPDVLAVHRDEGWLLMPDHGRAVVDVVDPVAQVAAIELLLPPYAALQRACAPMVDDWIDAGVPDRSAPRLPALLDRLLAGHGDLGPVEVDDAEAHRCRSLLGELTEVCERLGGSAVPRSVDHADIHGWNVLVGEGAPRLIDWGDACITHPFTSLLVPIEWVVSTLPPEGQAHAVQGLCDAYVEGWGSAVDRSLLGLAMWVGYVSRALSNDEQCAGGSDEVERDGRREIAALLRTWVAKADRLDRPAELLEPMLEL